MKKPTGADPPGPDHDPDKTTGRRGKEYAIRKAPYGKSGPELIKEAKEARRIRRGKIPEP